MTDKAQRYKLPKVEDIMTRKAVAFTTEFNTVDVLRTLNKHRISSAPVLKEASSKEIIGFISEEDCMNAIANNSFFDDFRNLSIEPVMKKEVKTVTPEMSLYELENFFRSSHLKHAPVVSDTGELMGIVSRRDVLVALEKIVDDIGLQKEKTKTPVVLSEKEMAKFILKNR